jgi:hypothetical protein
LRSFGLETWFVITSTGQDVHFAEIGQEVRFVRCSMARITALLAR